MPRNSKIGRGYYVGIYSALIDNPGWQELSGNAALVFYTLKMSTRLEGIGVFYNDRRFQAQARISADQIDEGLEELEEKGWIEREANILWVVHGLLYDPHLSSNNGTQRVSVQRYVASLPGLDIVERYREFYADWFSDAPPNLRPRSKPKPKPKPEAPQRRQKPRSREEQKAALGEDLRKDGL